MIWAPLLFIFLHHLTGSRAEVLFTQPQFVSGSLGQKITISCTRSTGNIESNYVYWYQQHSASAPRLLIYKYDQRPYNKRPSGIPDRFSGSIDSSSNSAVLTITALQIEDEADYYCQSSDSSYSHSDENHGGSETKTPQNTSCEITCEEDYCSFMSPAKVLLLGLPHHNFL
ncbi:Immunoglobulin lambda variable 1-40 [Lemmus lemmus]